MVSISCNKEGTSSSNALGPLLELGAKNDRRLARRAGYGESQTVLLLTIGATVGASACPHKCPASEILTTELARLRLGQSGQHRREPVISLSTELRYSAVCKQMRKRRNKKRTKWLF